MRKIKIWILYLVLSIIALIVAFPFIWLVITSLKTYPDIYHFPIIYWPSEVTWEHYGYVIRLDFLRYFLNSLVIGIGTAVLTIVIAALPSYAFGRLSFRGKRPLLLSILVCQMFPQVTFVNAFFVIFRRLGLINTHLGMMISYLPITTPIGIWILRNFFQGNIWRAGRSSYDRWLYSDTSFCQDYFSSGYSWYRCGGNLRFYICLGGTDVRSFLSSFPGNADDSSFSHPFRGSISDPVGAFVCRVSYCFSSSSYCFYLFPKAVYIWFNRRSDQAVILNLNGKST